MLKKDFAAQDIATFIADPRIRDGLIGGSAQASEALAGMNLDEIAAYRAKSIETGDALLDFGTLAPVTVVAPPEWTLTFSDNVLKPMMAGASALGEFAKKNETMATLAATGLQLAMMGPAKLIQTTIVDQVKERTIGEYTEQVNEYIHEKATSFLEDQWQFSHDEASFLATGVMFAGQLVMDSAKNALGTAKKINGMLAKATDRAAVGVTVGKNTAIWKFDGAGNPESVSGSLRESFSGAKRSSGEVKAQVAVGGSGLPGDHGGHLIGHRFFLDQGEKNLFPQQGNFNVSAFKSIENDYARYTAAGNQVNFTHTLSDVDARTGRPGAISVKFEVRSPTGALVDSFSDIFKNEAGQVYKRRAF